HESSRLYVAHTSNDDLDVIDSASDRFLRSIHGLKGAAGVLVSDERSLLFTANRGENTISILSAGREQEMLRLFSGIRPNGLAFDPSRGLLLVANVGDPEIGNSSTASMIDVDRKMVIGSVVLPGRPRWAVYDERTTAFYLNIADPPLIAEIDPKTPSKMLERYKMPAKGQRSPHVGGRPKGKQGLRLPTRHPPGSDISRRMKWGAVTNGPARDVHRSRSERREDVRRQRHDRSEERRAALPQRI